MEAPAHICIEHVDSQQRSASRFEAAASKQSQEEMGCSMQHMQMARKIGPGRECHVAGLVARAKELHAAALASAVSDLLGYPAIQGSACSDSKSA